jgi:molybdopterin-guanine dinucleotide biosynthesis protein A
VVLAGGASRRFGGAKGLEPVGGVRIIDRVANAIRAVTSLDILAANDPLAREWLDGVPVRADVFRFGGGLAGVHAALSVGSDILVVAWDMPFITPQLLQSIIDRAISSDASAVLPESRGPSGIEPFCAFYSGRALPEIDRFLAAGGGAAHEFLRRLPGAVRLPLREVARLGDPDRLFFSVNTPQDLQRARTMANHAE